jgi:hypothetical protein
VFHGLAGLIASLAPETAAVVIVRIVFRLVTHAIDDRDRWRRLMVLVVPLLTVALALTGVTVWWLLGDGGLQVILHGFGQATAAPPTKPRP